MLDAPIISGDTVVAALSQVHISPIGAKKRLSFACSKKPVAVLFSHGGKLAGADLNGTVMNAEAIEMRYPGILDQFKKVTDSA